MLILKKRRTLNIVFAVVTIRTVPLFSFLVVEEGNITPRENKSHDVCDFLNLAYTRNSASVCAVVRVAPVLSALGSNSYPNAK